MDTALHFLQRAAARSLVGVRSRMLCGRKNLKMFHSLPLGRYRELKRTHSERRERKGRNEGRIMRCQTGVFDGAQLAFQVLIIFCGQHCLPSWGLRGAGEGDRPN